MVQTTIVRSPKVTAHPAQFADRRREAPPETESLAGTVLMVVISLLIMACVFLGAV
jgi:hypothetical protein